MKIKGFLAQRLRQFFADLGDEVVNLVGMLLIIGGGENMLLPDRRVGLVLGAKGADKNAMAFCRGCGGAALLEGCLQFVVHILFCKPVWASIDSILNRLVFCPKQCLSIRKFGIHSSMGDAFRKNYLFNQYHAGFSWALY